MVMTNRGARVKSCNFKVFIEESLTDADESCTLTIVVVHNVHNPSLSHMAVDVYIQPLKKAFISPSRQG